jgi:four helix bundle protein
MFMFEKLKVYQMAVDLAVEISDLTDTFPRRTYHLQDQLNRASLSVAANLAEGNGRWHKRERRQFFYIARGSASECVPILEVCRRKGCVDDEIYGKLKDNIEEIVRMICGLVNGMDKRKA